MKPKSSLEKIGEIGLYIGPDGDVVLTNKPEEGYKLDSVWNQYKNKCKPSTVYNFSKE